ncbi:PAS domain-containing protein [Croceicoccus sp. Ery5]|uniref:PAS domain-containing protein n=1 Tax=Croceicoccus sp. Ery5 TaxID=1703340 RepID=UPI001E40A1E1|nr:PAS domain-containing protein [Croceicoccus sp. Ery5]
MALPDHRPAGTPAPHGGSDAPFAGVWPVSAVWVAMAACTLGVFAQPSAALVLALFPLAGLAAVTTGTRATAASLGIVASIALGMTALARGPLGDIAEAGLLCATLAVTTLPLAVLAGISRRDRAALAARHTEAERMLDTIDEVIFRIDDSGRWASLNAAWERITGISRADALGRPVDEFLAALGNSAERDKFTRLISGERGLVTSLHTIRRPDGDTRHIEVRMRGAFDGEGRPVGLVGHISDVTQTTRYRHALEDAERRFTTLANASPVGIWRTNARGDTLFVNRAFKAMTGLADGQWEGSHWITAIHPDDFDRVVTSWKDIVAQKAAFEGEWRWRRPDGSIVWVATTGAPQIDADGRVTGYVGMNIDITRQRGAECELAEKESQMRDVFDRIGFGGEANAEETDWDLLARQLRLMAGPQRLRPSSRKMRAA